MLTQVELKELLHYDPETGLFTRLVNRAKFRVGEVAGWEESHGYTHIGINKKGYKAHRLAFLYMTGKFPEGDVDHINGKKDDNRWCNLREATRSQNLFNRGAQKNNKLGIKGVTLYQGKYMASGTSNGKQKYLGCFMTEEEASKAYQEFAKQTQGEFYHSL
jgi:hypothetical protein